MNTPSTFQLVIFTVAWAVAIYGINCLIARRIKRIELAKTVLYVTAMAMNGMIGEIFFGSIYRYLFNHPLWNYTIYPIHHAYTSKYALLLWGLYGFHLYLLHGTLGEKKQRAVSTTHLALLFAGEAILIEGLVNLTYGLCFGHYVYYYFPDDLWHFTSLQALPFYVIGGYIVAITFKKFEVDPKFYIFMSTSVAIVLAFLT